MGLHAAWIIGPLLHRFDHGFEPATRTTPTRSHLLHAPSRSATGIGGIVGTGFAAGGPRPGTRNETQEKSRPCPLSLGKTSHPARWIEQPRKPSGLVAGSNPAGPSLYLQWILRLSRLAEKGGMAIVWLKLPALREKLPIQTRDKGRRFWHVKWHSPFLTFAAPGRIQACV